MNTYQRGDDLLQETIMEINKITQLSWPINQQWARYACPQAGLLGPDGIAGLF